MATRKTAETTDTADEKPPMAEWPETPRVDAVPTFDQQPGDRLRIFPYVALFGLKAREEAVVFDIPEVHACEATGLLEVLGKVGADG